VPLAQETPGQPDDELAFTGLDAWEIVILGVLLTASGVLLRRRLAQ
jgi:hypothetical protein